MTRLPNLDDYDGNYTDDLADVEARLHGVSAVRAADEGLIPLGEREESGDRIRRARCHHYFFDGRRCTYTQATCPGHKEKSSSEFILGEKP